MPFLAFFHVSLVSLAGRRGDPRRYSRRHEPGRPPQEQDSGRAWRTCSGSSRSCSCGRRHRPAAHRCVPRVCSPHHHSLPPFSPGGQVRRGRPVLARCVRVPVCLVVLPDLETCTPQIVFSRGFPERLYAGRGSGAPHTPRLRSHPLMDRRLSIMKFHVFDQTSHP